MASPNILCDTAGMSNERWLECRAHGPKGDIEYTVGGSDVATIFGISPWTTPLELWMIKNLKLSYEKINFYSYCLQCMNSCKYVELFEAFCLLL